MRAPAIEKLDAVKVITPAYRKSWIMQGIENRIFKEMRRSYMLQMQYLITQNVIDPPVKKGRG